MSDDARSKEWWGWLAGWLAIGALVVPLGLQLFAETSQRDLPVHIVDPITTAIFYVCLLVYFNGLREYAHRTANVQLLQTFNMLVVVNIIVMILLLPFTFIRYFDSNFATLSLVALIPILSIMGILFLRVAESFALQSELGVLGKRIVFWNRIGGWMLASVILAIPGALVSLIGEFYLWRLLARTSVADQPGELQK